MIDLVGTQFRDRRLLLPDNFKSRPVIQWWEPQGDRFHYKIVARGIGRAILWQGNFTELTKALSFWRSLQEIGPAPHEWDIPFPSWHPGLSIPGIVYEFATVTTFNSTGAWNVPGGVMTTSYLVVGQGGGGGGNRGGGGGGGDVVPGTASVGGSYTMTVGASAGQGGSPGVGSVGSTSSFGSVASAVRENLYDETTRYLLRRRAHQMVR
jgi:hypothetical protein